MTDPYLLDFPALGDADIGYISVSEQLVPFEVKRVFWTYGTPESIVRGRHAHYKTEQVLVAVAGRITVMTESATGEISTFRLDNPQVGLYVPPHVWHTMQYSQAAVQLSLASTVFSATDYIRDYDEFKRIWQPKKNR